MAYFLPRHFGVAAEFFLGRTAVGSPVLKSKTFAINFGSNHPLPFHPDGGNLSLRLRGKLHFPQPSRVRLAVVSLGHGQLRIQGHTLDYTGLQRMPWPADWRVTSEPAGDVTALVDRNLATRWTSGRPKTGHEEITVSFGRPLKVAGVVLDSSFSRQREGSDNLRVDLLANGDQSKEVAKVNLPLGRSTVVDAFFPAQAASGIRLRQRARYPHFYWFLHELYVIDEGWLSNHCISLNPGRAEKFELSYTPPLAGNSKDPHQIKRFYGPLILLWRVGQNPWSPVPVSALVVSPDRSFSAWLIGAVAKWQSWLPWLWAALLACWLLLLANKFSSSQPEPQLGPINWRWSFLAVALVWWIVIDDLAGISGLVHYFSRFVLNVRGQDFARQSWLLIGGLLAAAGVSCLLMWLFGRSKIKWTTGKFNFILAAFFLLQITLIVLWVRKLGLQSPLISEDNGSFIYGYLLCEKAHLLAVNYNPFWNAGAIEWEPLRSGIPALYMLGRSLVWFLPLVKAYTFSTPLIFALLLPWFVYFGLRWGGMGRGGALFGAALSLMPSTNWAYWMTEGACGGLLSAGITLPALILFWRLLEDPTPKWRHISLLVVFFSLALMWLPFVFAASVPAVVILLLHWRDLQPRRLLKVGVAIAFIAGINAIWIISFLHNFPVGDFTGHTVKPWAHFSINRLMDPVLVILSEVNPLVLVLGVIGLAMLQPSRRRDLIVFLACILLTMMLLDNLLPNYQLIRLHQYIAILLILPAAVFWERLWAAKPKGWARRAIASGLIPLLALQIVACGLFFDIRLNTRRPSVAPWMPLALAGWLDRQEAPPGRVLLVGHTLKQYYGSAAYLQMLCKRPMIADFYICTLQRKLEVNLPVNLCLKPPSPDEFLHLLKLYNVGQVVQYYGHKKWAQFLAGLPYLRQKQVIDGKFTIYETELPSNLFVEGRGKVVEGFNRLRVTPAVKGRLVLKYNYSKGLTASDGVRLSPARVWPGVDFIAADGHGGHPFDINF